MMKRFSNYTHMPNIALGRDGRLATGSKEHIELSRAAACEGMVLLKNDNNTLPLVRGQKIAVFGTAQFDYVRGGGGSGDVTTAYTRNIYEGFKLKEQEGLVNIYEPVSALYAQSVKQQKEEKGLNCRCEQPVLSGEMLDAACRFTDTAVLTICRYSWEGADRKGGLEDGDFYLNKGEKELKDILLANFKKVIVILDVGGVVDTDWFKKEEKVAAVLLAWQAGIEGGLAIADTVCGLSNPSGRLVDTFADTFAAYPSSEHFNDSDAYVDYTEDIFVGYRYFSSFKDAAGHVNYPFGFGLSYTTFTEKCVRAFADDENVHVEVKVTNTGCVPGKNATGLYFCAPDGTLGKASRELAAFAKTKLLNPGESELLILNFATDDMASYDDLGHVAKSAYILEAGTYGFYLGADVTKAVKLECEYVVDETRIVKQLTSKCAPHRLEKRLLKDGTYEKLATDDEPVTGRTTVYNGWTTPTGRTIVGKIDASVINMGTLDPDTEQIRQNEIPNLLDVAEGKQSLEDFVDKLPIEVLIEMLGGQPNTGTANTFGFGNFPEFGIPNIMTADGPAGLRINPGLGVATTAWPIATMLACTWNTELVEQVGAAGGLEVKENHIGLWLTPGMDLHRTPLCGRNFEYYSEDPLITGKMGAAMIRGIQSQKVGASMKHFACNEKEENRFICDSRVSERALREIYLKGFEIAVKEANPWSVMSSYNIVNGAYASRNTELLTGILREEWGYEGMVTTDWMNATGQEYEVAAGNDLKMPIGEPEALLKAYNEGRVSREEISKCAKRILELILKFD